MAVTHYDLSAKFTDLLGAAYSPTSAKVVAWIETNVASSEGIVDEVANSIALGGSRQVADSGGNVTWANLVGSDSDAADINLESGTLQYRVTAEYVDAITRRRKTWVSGWFSLTADIDLADVVAETYVPAAWMTTATATLQTYVDAGQAAATTASAAATTASGAADTAVNAAGLASEIALGDADAAFGAAQLDPASPLSVAQGDVLDDPTHPLTVGLANTFVATISPLNGTYGAVGDDTADDTAALNAAMVAGASFGIPVDGRGKTYKTTDELTIPAGTTLNNLTLHCTGTGKKIGKVTGDNVLLRRVSVTGRHGTATYAASEYAFHVEGASAAAPIRNFRMIECSGELTGMYGLWLKHVDGFGVFDCQLGDLGYAGIMGVSALNGHVVGCDIDNVLSGTGGNGYGIAFTREETDSLTTDPRSFNINIRDNTVSGVPWEGIDTHGGQNIRIVGNTVLGCGVGIAVVGTDNLANVATWAPKDVHVRGNYVDSLVTDGTGGIGITFAGAGGTVGSSTDAATGSIVDNTLKNCGLEASAISGAVYLRDTLGLAVHDNTIVNPSPHAILLYHDNYGFSIMGNTVIDQWSNTVSTPSVFQIPSGYATGSIVGNTHRDAGTKAAATYKNARGYNNADATGVSIEAVGNFLEQCVAPASGLNGVRTTFKFKAVFEQAAAFSAGSAGSPALYFGTDTDTGFYNLADNQLGFSAGGTLRMRFTSTGITFTDGLILSVGTSTGLYIGAGATSKLGFFGKTPVVQPSATPAAATDAATTQTLVNDLRTKLIALGLIA